MKKGKKIILVVAIIVMLVLLGLLINIFVNNKITEKDFVSELINIGNDVYSNYYYTDLANGKDDKEVAEVLEIFKDIGLKFDLNDLENYSYNVKKDDYIKTINNFIKYNKDCTKEDTQVIIYPKPPYTNDSFTTEVSIPCQYDE